jgi:hypothetical protein
LIKNVPYGVRYFLADHRVETVEDRGWGRVSNGELLEKAEAAGFDVVVTADQNILYQQRLMDRKTALIVLGSNLWPIVRRHAEEIAAQVGRVKPGSYLFIEMPVPPKMRLT